MVASRYGLKDERKEIWVFLEHNAGSLEGVALELLSKARTLADTAGWVVVGLLLGDAVASLATQAFTYGADRVLLAEHVLLKRFDVDTYTRVTFDALMRGKPSVFLCGATSNGRDLAGRLAVRLRTGLNADCTDLRLDLQSGVLVSEVSGFGGGVIALLEMRTHRPQMATFRPGVFSLGVPLLGRQGELVRIPVDLGAFQPRIHVLERVSGQRLDLTHAPLLVVGGRGVDGDFALLQQLADMLGGEVGATRPPVDDGYISRDRQIGQTGVICRPKIALLCGVSGAFHFVVGVQEADTIIAINNDPDAPIFDFADYCIIGDLFEVIPALIRELEARSN